MINYIILSLDRRIRTHRELHSNSRYMLLKRSIAFGTSSQELDRRSDLLGLDVHTTILFPEALSTILKAIVIVTYRRPPAHSDLSFHQSGGLEWLQVIDRICWSRSAGRIEMSNLANTGTIWNEVWKHWTGGLGHVSNVPAQRSVGTCRVVGKVGIDD
jgi:hypothetical protein